MSLLLQLGAALFAGLACFLFFLTFYRVGRELPADDRSYRDPLPWSLRLLWPLVRFFAHHLGERLSVEYLERLKRDLVRSGLDYLLAPEQFFALRLVAGLCAALLCALCLALLDAGGILGPVLAGLGGYVLPQLSLSELRKQRELALVRALPTYLDFIILAVEAGLNLGGALAQAVDKGPEGPLRTEFQRVLRDVKAGLGRTAALRAMAERLNIRELSSLVSALAQAERTGASVGAILRIQADQRRVERFQRAEKKALEAPVKLVFPLVAFIFPVTFVVLAFPIAMKFLYEL